ncbi:UNVERIFIED_CONTAM: hypothetical protein LK11_01195 [Mumia flava]
MTPGRRYCLPVASKDDKRARQARAEQMRKERERQEKRRRNIITAVIVVAVVAVIAGAGFAVKTAIDNNADVATRAPEGLTDGNGVLYTAEDAGGTAGGDPVQVTLFEDFACPHCKSFEASTGVWLDEQVAAGTIEVEFRPVSFLTEYSSDALAASMCVFEEGGAEAYRTFATLAYENQPAEGGNLDASDFVQFAEESGTPEAADCIRGRPFRDWASPEGEATKQAFEDEDSEGNTLSGTPTVWVEGTTVNGPEDADGNPTVPGTEDIQQAIQEAGGTAEQ